MSQPPIRSMPRSRLARLAGEQAATHAQTGSGTRNWMLNGVVWQHCLDCAHVFFPAQPLCPDCLSERFAWRHSDASGKLLSRTKLHVSFSELFKRDAPWNIGLIAHPLGPDVFAFLADDVEITAAKVSLFTVPDATGQAVFVAVSPGSDAEQRAATTAAGLAVPAD